MNTPVGEVGILDVTLHQPGPIPLAATFRCAPGETLALIGPSGSGKTTVLRMIAGLAHPAEGRIAVGGGVWLDTAAGIALAPQARRVGLMFQNYALFPHMTAAGNVLAAIDAGDPSARREEARRLLASVNMEGLENRRPDALSGGQRQRVALARALARRPKVLLLDEPFSAVDQVTRRRLQRELLILRRDLDIPVVLVTHDLREAMRLGDRIALLARGTILQQGPPGDVMARPVSRQAARLLDHSNIFEGRLREVAPGAGTGTTGRLDWHGLELEVGETNNVAVCGKVDWVIPASGILLHRRDRPSRGERENPVSGEIVEMVALGDEIDVVLRPDHAPDLPLSFRVARHTAERNSLTVGVAATVSLLADAIHVMPET